MKSVDRCLENFLMPLLCADCVRKWGHKCRTPCTFLYSIDTIEIVALWSVKKIFAESYDFAAKGRVFIQIVIGV
jgi:hypothetical protein